MHEHFPVMMIALLLQREDSQTVSDAARFCILTVYLFCTNAMWNWKYINNNPPLVADKGLTMVEYYMLLHPLEGSITLIAQDPCRAGRGGAAGVAGDKCDTSDGRAIPTTGGRYQRQEGDTTCTPLGEQ